MNEQPLACQEARLKALRRHEILDPAPGQEYDDVKNKKVPNRGFDLSNLGGGTETILLVEDDPALRETTATLLRRLGYTVFTASIPAEIFSLKTRLRIGRIDLLLTNVATPRISGRSLADRVRTVFPHTKILLISAYPKNVIVHQSLPNRGVALLQKPFTPSALAHKLRQLLDYPELPNRQTCK